MIMEYSNNQLEIQQKSISQYYQAILSEQLMANPLTLTKLLEEAYKKQQQNYTQTFYGKTQRTILSCKKKIIQILLQERKRYFQTNQWALVLKKLRKLNRDKMQLLNEEIINIAIQLNSVQEKYSELSQVIAKILVVIHPLLRHFFVYQQYRSKESQRRNLQNQQNEQFLDNFKVIQEIQEKLAAFTIQELIHSYSKKQKQSIKDLSEICRICSKKVKLQQLNRHLLVCSTLSSLNQKMKELDNQIAELLFSIKQKEQQLLNQINQFDEQDKQNIDLLNIYKSILKGHSKINKLRRNSTFGANKSVENNFFINILIDDYVATYGQNITLFSFQQLIKEKQNLQLEIQKFQQNNPDISSLQSQSRISISSLSNIPTVLSHIKDKKSKFAADHTIQTKKINNRSSAMKQPRSSTQKIIPIKSNEHNNKQNHTYRTIRFKQKKNFSLIKPSSQLSLSSKKCYSENLEINLCFDFPTISLKDFEILKFLGKGAFGHVYLVRRTKTNDLYALKVIKISQQWGEKELQIIRNEQNTLKNIAGNHLVKAHFSFNEGLGHFFVMEFIPRGDLSNLLAKQVYLEQKKVKFYIAQIVLAIQHLHNFGIIHRDLKPENLVIDKDGHLKLTDFGLSQVRIKDKLQKVRQCRQTYRKSGKKLKSSLKRKGTKKSTLIMQKQNTVKLIGTPDYIAPEIINKISINNETIDWWSLGVMTYELMIGVKPFSGYTIEEIIDNILQFKIEWPQIGYGENMISPIAQNFILKLLDKNYKTRLGFNGSSQIKDHPFFQGIDWDNIKNVKPPIQVQKLEQKEFENVPESAILREQIEKFIQLNGQSQKKCKSLNGQQPVDNDLKKSSLKSKSQKKVKLGNFVRFDLLQDETIVSAQKAIKQQQAKIQQIDKFSKSFGQLTSKFTSSQSSIEQYDQTKFQMRQNNNISFCRTSEGKLQQKSQNLIKSLPNLVCETIFEGAFGQIQIALSQKLAHTIF